jgi:hypothetical protein
MKILVQVLAWMLLAWAGGAYGQSQDILGAWQGKLAIDANTQLTIDFMFTRRPDGAWVAVLNSPDNPAVKNLLASNVTFANGELKLDVPSLSGSYTATLKDGSLHGQWKQPTGTLPLVLTPPRIVPMTAAAAKALTGAWSGPLKIPNGQLTLVFRFAPDGKGGMVGTVTSPEQNDIRVQVSDLVFVDDQLSFKVPSNLVEARMTHANGVLTGRWKQPGMGPDGLPLTMTRGDAPGKTFPLALSREAFTALEGRWTTKLGPANVALRFERDDKGQVFGWVDNLDHKLSVPVGTASLAGKTLTFQVGSAGTGEFSGELAGSSIKGNWKQGPQSTAVELKRN